MLGNGEDVIVGTVSGSGSTEPSATARTPGIARSLSSSVSLNAFTLSGLVVFSCWQAIAHGEQLSVSQPMSVVSQTQKTLQQKSGGDQQNYGDCDLYREQRFTQRRARPLPPDVRMRPAEQPGPLCR